MGGPKNAGQIKDGVAKTGYMSTDSAQINFIVPSIGVLSNFNVRKIDLSGQLKPGVLHPMFDVLQTQGANEYLMCADAKKVTAGVDIVGGDVDMFGYEDGTFLSERKRSLEEESLRIEEIKGSFTFYLCSLPLENLPNEIKITAKQNLVDFIKSISKRIKDGREL